MLRFDLSNTPLATSGEIAIAPNGNELFAILLALMSVERCSFKRLRGRTLVLNDKNLDAVAHAIHTRLPLFFQRYPGEHATRWFLTWLHGLTVSRWA